MSFQKLTSGISAGKIGDLMAKAEAFWKAGPMNVPWEHLSKEERRFAAVTYAALDQDADERPVFLCFRCRDSLFIHHTYKGRDVSWFCKCEGGTKAETGYWRERLRSGNTKRVNEFNKYLRQVDDIRGLKIRDAVLGEPQEKPAPPPAPFWRGK